MRYIFILAVVGLAFSSCKKDKFNTVPEISFKKVEPKTIFFFFSIPGKVIPMVILHVTDAEGDLGLVPGSDTSKVYIKSLLGGREDSLLLPVLGSAATKNFEGDIEISLATVLEQSPRPAPKTDSLYYEIYIKDFAKNKSNVIKTTEPVLFIFP